MGRESSLVATEEAQRCWSPCRLECPVLSLLTGSGVEALPQALERGLLPAGSHRRPSPGPGSPGGLRSGARGHRGGASRALAGHPVHHGTPCPCPSPESQSWVADPLTHAQSVRAHLSFKSVTLKSRNRTLQEQRIIKSNQILSSSWGPEEDPKSCPLPETCPEVAPPARPRP